MISFSEFPQYLLKQFIIEEKKFKDGHRLFLIKKKKKSFIFWKKYETLNIPHKYQQNNTLMEAQESIKQYLIQEVGVRPLHQHHSRSFWKKVFLLNLR